MRIEITGSIGSGKTSLAKLLLENGYNLVFEEFRNNPFWKAFYANPLKYNFETEITFLLQHYHELKRKLEENNDVVCDFSFTQDLGYAVMGLNDEQLKIFRSLYSYIINELGEPTLIIYLKCSPKTLLHRIHSRGRSEESLIDVSFLSSLSNCIKQEIEIKLNDVISTSFLEIDTEVFNLVNSPSDQSEILRKISGIYT